MPSSSSDRSALTTGCLAALVVLLAVKVATIAWIGPSQIELDAAEYWDLSSSVLAGHALLQDQAIAYRTPGYPWFLTVVRWISGHHAVMAVMWIQAALYVATYGLAASMAYRLTGRKWVAALTYALAVPLLSAPLYVTTVLSETLFVFLLMLQVDAVHRYATRRSTWGAVWVGVTFATTLLVRPIVLWLWVIHLGYLIMVTQRSETISRRPTWGHIALAGLVGLALISPWLARNAIMFGKPMMTEFIGRNIWIVTFQDSSGAGLPLPPTATGDELRRRTTNAGVTGEAWRHTWTTSRALVQSGLTDPQADRLMKRVSLEAARRDMATFGYKTIRRIVNFWRSPATELPEPGVMDSFEDQVIHRHHDSLGSRLLTWRTSHSVAANTVAMFFLLGVVAVWIICPHRRIEGLWLVGIIAYFNLVTGILEFPALRYRMVLDPIVIMMIASIPYHVGPRSAAEPTDSSPEPSPANA